MRTLRGSYEETAPVECSLYAALGREEQTAVGKEADDGATESGARPEVAGDDAVQSDVERPGGVDGAAQREEELGLDELSTARAPSAPLDAAVADVEYQPRVLPADHAVHHLEQVVPAVDAHVAVARQTVAVDTHLFVEYLRARRAKSIPTETRFSVPSCYHTISARIIMLISVPLN